MGARRLLWMLVGLLLTVVVVGGGAVVWLAGLTLFAPRPVVQQLLIVGDDSRLRTINVGGAERVLATDASADAFRYPAAAPNGRHIAYIAEDAQGLAIYRLDLGSGERRELYRSTENPPLYLAWSPDSRNISFLSNLEGGGLGLHVVPSDGAHTSDLIGTTRGTSYFAWNPDSSTLLLHTGGSSFENGRIATYQPGKTQPAPIRDDPGFFQAPAWSTDGSQLYYVAQPPIDGQISLGQITSVLTSAAPDGSNPAALATEAQAALFFSRSPASNLIAYTTMSASGYGPLKIVDASTGGVKVVSRGDDQVAAFFWSPDGTNLAYLTVAGRARSDTPRLMWHIVASSGGAQRDLVSFLPSRAFATMIGYFDAYAMSFSLWSPDSRRLTYTATDGVYVIDIASGQAARTAEGTLALWVGR